MIRYVQVAKCTQADAKAEYRKHMGLVHGPLNVNARARALSTRHAFHFSIIFDVYPTTRTNSIARRQDHGGFLQYQSPASGSCAGQLIQGSNKQTRDDSIAALGGEIVGLLKLHIMRTTMLSKDAAVPRRSPKSQHKTTPSRSSPAPCNQQTSPTCSFMARPAPERPPPSSPLRNSSTGLNS